MFALIYVLLIVSVNEDMQKIELGIAFPKMNVELNLKEMKRRKIFENGIKFLFTRITFISD